MELRIPLPFTKHTPSQVLRKIAKLDNQLKSFGLPTVIAQSNGENFYSLFGSAGKSVSIDCTTAQGQADAYNICPPLNAVTNRWLRAAANARWLIVDQDGKAITPNKSPLPELMNRPNALQSWGEFILQSLAMKRIHGQVYWLKLRPEGMNDVKSLWVIPNYMIREYLTGNVFKQSEISGIVQRYEITFGGTITSIPVDDIIKLRDTSVNFYTGTTQTISQGNGITDGQSRLYAMSDVINALTAAYVAKKQTIIKRGPLGILTGGGSNSINSNPLTDPELKKIHDQFEKIYGVGEGQRQEILTKADVKWVQITKGIKDLMLFEEIEAGTREICAAMDYPFELIGYQTGSSLAGGGKIKELKSMLYTDSIIPETESIGDALAYQFLQPGQYLRPFFDHLDVFQKSRQDDATALKVYNEACKLAVDGGAMTLQEWQAGIKNYL